MEKLKLIYFLEDHVKPNVYAVLALFLVSMLTLPATAEASILKCTGLEVLDASGSSRAYEVVIDAAQSSFQPGYPVTVAISKKIDSNTGEPADFGQPDIRDGGYYTGPSEILIVFKGGELRAEPDGDGGLSGALKVDGKRIPLYCTI